jgi:hypothetical protein
MQRFKRTIRLLGLVLLMLLASIGVGLSGGVPLSRSSKENDLIEIRQELTDQKEEEEPSDPDE